MMFYYVVFTFVHLHIYLFFIDSKKSFKWLLLSKAEIPGKNDNKSFSWKHRPFRWAEENERQSFTTWLSHDTNIHRKNPAQKYRKWTSTKITIVSEWKACAIISHPQNAMLLPVKLNLSFEQKNRSAYFKNTFELLNRWKWIKQSLMHHCGTVVPKLNSTKVVHIQLHIPNSAENLTFIIEGVDSSRNPHSIKSILETH